MSFADLTEKRIHTKEIYKGKIIDVYCDDILLPNGNKATREYIKHIGAACVVPLTENGEVLMVRQYRYPFEKVLLEVPAGKLDEKSEDPKAAALRELREETGASAEELTYLGAYYPTCAYSDEVIHIYLARNLSFGETHFDEDEFIEPERISLETLIEMVMRGEIPDGKTQTALLKAYYYLQNEKN